MQTSPTYCCIVVDAINDYVPLHYTKNYYMIRLAIDIFSIF